MFGQKERKTSKENKITKQKNKQQKKKAGPYGPATLLTKIPNLNKEKGYTDEERKGTETEQEPERNRGRERES